MTAKIYSSVILLIFLIGAAATYFKFISKWVKELALKNALSIQRPTYSRAKFFVAFPEIYGQREGWIFKMTVYPLRTGICCVGVIAPNNEELPSSDELTSGSFGKNGIRTAQVFLLPTANKLERFYLDLIGRSVNAEKKF